jgi:copper oxidase (laccase) domain-containing protein
MTDRHGTVTALGESTLSGWRGAVGTAVARPVAKRTRFSEEQIRTAIGLALLAYGLYRVLWPPFRAPMRSR